MPLAKREVTKITLPLWMLIENTIGSGIFWSRTRFLISLKMSYLHRYSGFFLYPPFHLVFLTCLVVQFPSRTAASTSAQALVTAGSGNVDLVFPTFNDSTFSCTGSPPIVGYFPCKYNLGGSCDFLAPKYNYLYPNQSGRLMYKQSVEFNVPADQVASVNFSTFILFQISHVPKRTRMGAGIAFIIAPTIDTPLGSEGGGLGLYTNNTIPKITSPAVIAIEFDTSYTPGIDEEGVGIPHIGLDDGSLQSVNFIVVGSEFLDTPVGMWIDYDDNASTLSVYSTPVQGKMDASAANLKPKTPLFIQESFNVFANSTDFNRGYIGISGGIDNGGWENNKIFYWRFTTTGYPHPAALSSWYVWYGNLSTTSKLAIIIGGLLGTLAGAFGCSELVFHLFCQRVKKPSTTEEKAWPYRWRTSLPGTKVKEEPPPRKKVRDSLSVTTPLYLWEAPAEPEWRHGNDVKSRDSPDTELSDDQAPLISPTSNAEQGYNQESEVDTSNGVDFAESPETDALVEESPDIDAPVEVAGEDVEAQAQELNQSSMAVQKAVSPPEEKPPEVAKKPAPIKGIIPAAAREKAPAGKETKPLPTETKALIKKKPVQVPEKNPALEAKTGLELVKKVALIPIEKKLVQAPEKKPEQETKTGLMGVKKTAPLIEKKPVQVGKGPAPIESLKVPPQVPEVLAQAEKGPTSVRKAVTPLGETPSDGIQKPPTSDRRVRFEAANPSASNQQRLVPAEEKASSLAGQPGSPLKQTPLAAEKKVSPLAGQASSPPKQTPLPAEKKVSPLAGQPASSPKQSPLPAEKKISPPARQPSSPPKQGPVQGAKKVKPQAGLQKGAPDVADSQKSQPKGPGPLHVAEVKRLKGPRQSPRRSQKLAVPRPSPKTSPRSASPLGPEGGPQPSPQSSQKAVQRPSPLSPPKKSPK